MLQPMRHILITAICSPAASADPVRSAFSIDTGMKCRVAVYPRRIVLIRSIVKPSGVLRPRRAPPTPDHDLPAPREWPRFEAQLSCRRRGESCAGEPTRSGVHDGGSLAGKLSAESSVTRSNHDSGTVVMSAAPAGSIVRKMGIMLKLQM